MDDVPLFVEYIIYVPIRYVLDVYKLQHVLIFYVNLI